MQEFNNIYPDNKQDMYQLLKEQMKAMLEGERDVISNLSNCSALLNEALTRMWNCCKIERDSISKRCSRIPRTYRL